MSRYPFGGLSTLRPAPETAFDPPPAQSSNISNLEKRVALQKAALDQALDDLAAARARQGLSPSPATPGPRQTAPIDVAATVAFIERTARRCRGEEPCDVTPPQVPADNEDASAPMGTEAMAAFIINAGKKRRSEI
jgi:hypothetical protein